MKRIGSLALAVALGGCAAGPPLIDMTDINPVTYQRDFDQCQVEAQGDEPAGPIVVGALIGASFGFGLAGFAAAPGSTGILYGGAAGAVSGAGLSAATGTPLGAQPPVPRQSLADCLAAHGYKVISR
jgi:hypothetical protein